MPSFSTFKTHPLTPGQQLAFQRLATEAQIILARAQAQADALFQGYMKGIGIEYGLEEGQWQLSPDGTMLLRYADADGRGVAAVEAGDPNPPVHAEPLLPHIDVKPNGGA